MEVAPTVAESMNRDERKLMLTKEIKRADAMAPAYESELLAKPATIIVQPQDNLFDIASIAGISVMDLARYNNLRPDPRTRCLNLHPGQILYIPSRSLLDKPSGRTSAKEREPANLRWWPSHRDPAPTPRRRSHRASSRAALDAARARRREQIRGLARGFLRPPRARPARRRGASRPAWTRPTTTTTSECASEPGPARL